ncbi:hypothetical protein MASR2M64_05170 [Candidatus Cloacimonadota bacterium]
MAYFIEEWVTGTDGENTYPVIPAQAGVYLEFMAQQIAMLWQKSNNAPWTSGKRI